MSEVSKPHSGLLADALKLARELREEIPDHELPKSGLLLLSLALLDLEEQHEEAHREITLFKSVAEANGDDYRRLKEQYEGSITRESAQALIKDANHWQTCYVRARDELAELKEQLEAALARNATYGPTAEETITHLEEQFETLRNALTEILERPHGELDEHEMRSVAHAALDRVSNPAKRPS